MPFEAVALGHHLLQVAPGALSRPLRLCQVALHFDALVFRDHAVHLAADLQPLELSVLRLKPGTRIRRARRML